MKTKMAVVGQNINMGFYGIRQRSPAKKRPSCETSGANLLNSRFQ